MALALLAAARALPSSMATADSLDPTLRTLDELEEDVQSVGDLLAVKRARRRRRLRRRAPVATLRARGRPRCDEEAKRLRAWTTLCASM